MEKTTGPVSSAFVLAKVLEDQTATLRVWTRECGLEAFPADAAWEDEAVRKLPSLHRWDWSDWDALNEAADWGNYFLTATKDVQDAEVAEARKALSEALKPVENFIGIVGDHTEEFCC